MLHSQAVRERGTERVLLADDQPVVGNGVRSAVRRTLEIDGSQWRSQRDFYDALTGLLGSVERHCCSSEAVVETMIYYPDLNTQQPPYDIVITNASAGLRPFLFDFARGVAEARQDRRVNPAWGDDVGVVVTVA